MLSELETFIDNVLIIQKGKLVLDASMEEVQRTSDNATLIINSKDQRLKAFLDHKAYIYTLNDGVRDGILINPTIVDARTDITTELLSEKGLTINIDEDDVDESDEKELRDAENKYFKRIRSRKQVQKQDLSTHRLWTKKIMLSAVERKNLPLCADKQKALQSPANTKLI